MGHTLNIYVADRDHALYVKLKNAGFVEGASELFARAVQGAARAAEERAWCARLKKCLACGAEYAFTFPDCPSCAHKEKEPESGKGVLVGGEQQRPPAPQE